MPKLLTVTSATEPVTMAEAKLAARLDASDTALDGLVTGLITSAREQAEQITGRYYRDVLVRQELFNWPSSTCPLPIADARSCAVSWWTGSAWSTAGLPAFVLAADGFATVIGAAVGSSWPSLGSVAAGPRVRLDFATGPTDPSLVKECVKLYIKAQVSAWVNTPDALASTQLQRNPLFDRLLDSELTWAL